MTQPSSSSSTTPTPRKMSSSMVMLIATILGVVVGLFGLNYWHATRCGVGAKTPDEIETYVEGINRRLLQAESLTIKNGLMLEKLLTLLQPKLVTLEAHEMEEITKKSQDEAVRLAILLSGQPAPPMPEFDLDPQYEDAEKLADAVDDALKGSDKDDYSSSEREEWGKYDKDKWDDKEFSYKKSVEEASAKEPTLTDAEAMKTCTEWKEKYSVVIGVSWGQLPFDLQKRWLKISCDYHFRNDHDTKITASTTETTTETSSPTSYPTTSNTDTTS